MNAKAQTAVGNAGTWMTRLALRWGFALVMLPLTGSLLTGERLTTVPCVAAELDAMGNTDGVLTWRLGALESRQSAREGGLFVSGA